jgi:trans-aconitate methyltransferase
MTAAQRETSYGERRTFRGLEDFAIKRRLQAASQLIKTMATQDPGKNHKILELGCGFWGRNLVQLSKEFSHMNFTGVDLSVSNEVHGIQLIEADIMTWEPAHEYDLVLSLAVVEHLLDPQKHFDLIATCLKKGGYAGLTTPSPQAHLALDILSRLGIFDRAEIMDHKLYITETGVRQLATRGGLTIEEIRSFLLGMNQWTLLRKN